MLKRHQIDLKRPGKKIRRNAKKTNEYLTSCISLTAAAPQQFHLVSCNSHFSSPEDRIHRQIDLIKI